MFGWAIVLIVEDDGGEVTDAYPTRVPFRGFSNQEEAEGFTKLTAYLKEQYKGKKDAENCEAES